jgi:predicted Zn finger-like uncharacterized protein
MIITCPSCEAQFDVDPVQLGAEGRTVRCSQCGTDWYQDRADPAPSAARRAGAGGVRQGAKPAALWPRVRWGLLSVLLVAWVAWLARDWVVDRYPPAAGIYARLGIAVEMPAASLLLEDVTSVRRLVEGNRVLIISGMVRNLAAEAREVPRLRASLSDGEGNELVSWEFSAEADLLNAGARTRFRTTTDNPPRTGASLALGFVTED